MRRLPIDHPAAATATLARDVVGTAGEVLARAGHPMSPRAIRALAEREVTTCYVEDEASAGVVLTPIAPDEILRPLRQAFALFVRRAEAAVEPLRRQPTPLILETLRSSTFPLQLQAAPSLSELRTATQALARHAADVDGSCGFLTDRQADDDIVGHSIMVAALTARIGGAIGFDANDTAAATLAALFHDIGMVFVPAEIRLTPPARRSAPQRMRFEDHPVLGEALLSVLAKGNLALALIALEHHETQDGSGYPRHLRGANRVLRRIEGEQTAEHISLVSEVVAVADHFERLVSPAPDRAGLSPAAARSVLSGAAGSVLNAEVVARFLDAFPAFPLGTEVRLVGGAHDGLLGVVCGLGSGTPQRPQVRVSTIGGATVVLDLRTQPAVQAKVVDQAAA